MAANAIAPGADDAEGNDSCTKESKHISTPHQTILFDRAEYIPAADDDEACETLRRAIALRDFLREHGSGTLEAALAAAGMPLAPPSPMRAFVVNCRAPIVAMKYGWAIPSGGIARARISIAAHGGRIGHYLRGAP